MDAAGKTVDVHSHAIEVLRCHPDGTWKLVVGDPQGRGRPDGAAGGRTQ
jgi:hypothetical protein